MSTRPIARLKGTRLDLVVAAAMLVVSLAPGVHRVITGTMPSYAWAMLLAGPLVFPLWRRYPRTVMLTAVVAMVAVGHVELGPMPAVPALVAIAVCMYSGNRVLAVSTVLTVSVATAIGNWREADWHFTEAMVQQSMLVIGWLHVALVSGESRRQRDAYIEEAEHTKEEAVRRKASDERVRIARELHDSLTHSISVIRVQAGVALHLARKRGQQPAPALVAVEEAAKDATRELRETLTMLRGDEGPRLLRIKDLVDRYQGLGFDIAVDCGDAGATELEPDVDHAAYRIVQEALTNAVRHSTGDRVTVRIARADHSLDVEVSDNGTVEEFAPGRGITGMRERVDSLGGALVVGPGAAGFSVRAQLPVRDETVVEGAVC